MSAFRNLTPHEVKVCSPDLWPVHTSTGTTISPGEAAMLHPTEVHQPPAWRIAPDPAGPARVAVVEEPAGEHGGVPLSRPRYGEVTGLPEPEPGVLLIVSMLVQQACPGRDDLVIPSGVIRDDAGVIIGCRSLGRPPRETRASDDWVDGYNSGYEVGWNKAASPAPEPAAATIELPGLDRATEERRRAERQVIRMACRLVDDPDRRHITLPGLAGAVAALRGEVTS